MKWTLRFSRLAIAAAAVSLGLVLPLSAAEPIWPTHRGNSERTGCVDGQPGPKTPKVLWAVKSPDHFLASPVPAGDRLLVAGLSAFNVGNLAALPTASTAGPIVPLWARSMPPIVSAPAVADGLMVFGDGMHQIDGGNLHCLRTDTGRPVWQLPTPGSLVHLEGAPTFIDGRVTIGGGSAGVLCVDARKASLDGQELDAAAVKVLLETKWKELQAKYEADKKKDPDFAIPPTEDQLPKPTPKFLWQAGKDQWHVDAPVAVVAGRVFVASAFLDKEQRGKRSLFALDAGTGAVVWETPLPLNPWGGPAVGGDTVVVTGSNIGYDLKGLSKAKGDLAAFDRATGRLKWRKEIPGGAIGCAALADGAAVVTATDGKVRAFDLATGERRWLYDAKVPFFAPPAVAGGAVYTADLQGGVYAVSLADGKLLWKLDLGKDPATQAPGMAYGGPVVHAGRLYVATCNIDGPSARKPSVVVAIGEP